MGCKAYIGFEAYIGFGAPRDATLFSLEAKFPVTPPADFRCPAQVPLDIQEGVVLHLDVLGRLQDLAFAVQASGFAG